MATRDLVSVTIVTYNSGRYIKRCLESVLGQRGPDIEVIVVDNNSTDGTRDILEQYEDRCAVTLNPRNLGFAAAQNQAILRSRGNWVLTLNPDVLLMPYFIQALVEAGRNDPSVGTVCGTTMAPALLCCPAIPGASATAGALPPPGQGSGHADTMRL